MSKPSAKRKQLPPIPCLQVFVINKRGTNEADYSIYGGKFYVSLEDAKAKLRSLHEWHRKTACAISEITDITSYGQFWYVEHRHFRELSIVRLDYWDRLKYDLAEEVAAGNRVKAGVL